jgi:hypothetical protein
LANSNSTVSSDGRQGISARSFGRLAIEEQNVRLHSLGVENARGQAQQRVNVGLLQQFTPNRLSGAAFEQHIVGYDDCRSPMNLQARFHVLQEVELLVAGGRPKIVADIGQRFFASHRLLR